MGRAAGSASKHGLGKKTNEPSSKSTTGIHDAKMRFVAWCFFSQGKARQGKAKKK